MGERMISEPNPEDIERQMAEMRSALQQDVRVLATEARTLTDWRTHFRAHPLLFCGIAAALGFILVPRARKVYSVLAPTDRGPFVRPMSDRSKSAQSSSERANQHETDGQASENDAKVLFRLNEPSTLSDRLFKPLLKMAAVTLARESANLAMNRMRASYRDAKSAEQSHAREGRSARGGQS
jgi:hypothetical protein